MKERKFEDKSEYKTWGVFANSGAGILTPVNFNDLHVLGSGLSSKK